MAGELQFYNDSGMTCYFLIRNSVGQIWNNDTSAFVTYATADYTNYDVAAVEQGTASGYYVGTFPSAIPAGVYSILAKKQAGGSPAETDLTLACGEVQWAGAAVLPLSNLATSGQVGQYLPLRPFRGQMLQNYPFHLVSSADHVTDFTSGVISGQINRDGAGFVALQSGAFTEQGYGWYTLQAFTSGDLLANTAAVRFTGRGISGGLSDSENISFLLQRTSGQ